VNKASKWLTEKRGNLSQRDLAKLVGLSHGTIANAESGDATAKTWIALANYFNEDSRQVLHWAGLGDAPAERDPYILRVENKLSKIKDNEKRQAIEGLIDSLSPDKKGGGKRTAHNDEVV